MIIWNKRRLCAARLCACHAFFFSSYCLPGPQVKSIKKKKINRQTDIVCDKVAGLCAREEPPTNRIFSLIFKKGAKKLHTNDVWEPVKKCYQGVVVESNLNCNQNHIGVPNIFGKNVKLTFCSWLLPVSVYRCVIKRLPSFSFLMYIQKSRKQRKNEFNFFVFFYSWCPRGGFGSASHYFTKCLFSLASFFRVFFSFPWTKLNTKHTSDHAKNSHSTK